MLTSRDCGHPSLRVVSFQLEKYGKLEYVCKRCYGNVENLYHLFIRPAVRAIQNISKAGVTTLIEWMESVKTSPFIVMTVMDTRTTKEGTFFREQCPARTSYIASEAKVSGR